MINFNRTAQLHYVPAIIMGVTKFQGDIDGNKIDSCNVLIATPLNETTGNAKGFGVAKVAFGDSSNYAKLSLQDFPCEMEVAYESVTNANGVKKEILRDVRLIRPAKA